MRIKLTASINSRSMVGYNVNHQEPQDTPFAKQSVSKVELHFDPYYEEATLFVTIDDTPHIDAAMDLFDSLIRHKVILKKVEVINDND